MASAHPMRGKGRGSSTPLAPAADGHLLEDRQDLIDTDEGHLEIHLGELELAVGALILVAKASGDLEVALAAADHEQLLDDLRGLGQRVERPRVVAARDEEITRTLRGRSSQHRRLDLQEAALDEGTSHRLREAMAQLEGSLEGSPAEVVDAMAQTHLLVDTRILLEREGRRSGDIEDPELRGDDLHRTGGKLRVDRLFGAVTDAAGHRDHELRAQLRGPGMGLRGGVGPEHHLEQAAAVAQVDEDDPAVVAPSVHPARDHDLAADTVLAHGTRRIGTAQCPERVELGLGRSHLSPGRKTPENSGGWLAEPPARGKRRAC
jgi:hypothetical protein